MEYRVQNTFVFRIVSLFMLFFLCLNNVAFAENNEIIVDFDVVSVLFSTDTIHEDSSGLYTFDYEIEFEKVNPLLQDEELSVLPSTTFPITVNAKSDNLATTKTISIKGSVEAFLNTKLIIKQILPAKPNLLKTEHITYHKNAYTLLPYYANIAEDYCYATSESDMSPYGGIDAVVFTNVYARDYSQIDENEELGDTNNVPPAIIENMPKTGDNSTLYLWSAILGIASIVILVLRRRIA